MAPQAALHHTGHPRAPSFSFPSQQAGPPVSEMGQHPRGSNKPSEEMPDMVPLAPRPSPEAAAAAVSRPGPLPFQAFLPSPACHLYSRASTLSQASLPASWGWHLTGLTLKRTRQEGFPICQKVQAEKRHFLPAATCPAGSEHLLPGMAVDLWHCAPMPGSPPAIPFSSSAARQSCPSRREMGKALLTEKHQIIH